MGCKRHLLRNIEACSPVCFLGLFKVTKSLQSLESHFTFFFVTDRCIMLQDFVTRLGCVNILIGRTPSLFCTLILQVLKLSVIQNLKKCA